ncbi:MAG TPA: MBL fold metallo-hydrolase [Ktedonobacterales bacterium]|nr:MBL fold metallo-hydrolase [Ktedonobacterales bacterium]
MKTTAHGEHLHKLTRMWAFNCFLVREEDGFTLVDTNLSGSAQQILAAAQALDAPIVRIALTHAHVDHVGSLDVLHERLPQAEVLITARDARFMTGDHSLDPEEPQDKLRGGYPICTTKPTRTIAPGDMVGSLEVIASPGHTPGHVAFLDRRDRTLIAGDAYQTRGGIAVAGVIQPLFPLPGWSYWSRAVSLQSAEALRKLEPARLAVGHGPVLEAPLAAMDHAIAVARRRFQEPSAHAA